MQMNSPPGKRIQPNNQLESKCVNIKMKAWKVPLLSYPPKCMVLRSVTPCHQPAYKKCTILGSTQGPLKHYLHSNKIPPGDSHADEYLRSPSLDNSDRKPLCRWYGPKFTVSGKSSPLHCWTKMTFRINLPNYLPSLPTWAHPSSCLYQFVYLNPSWLFSWQNMYRKREQGVGWIFTSEIDFMELEKEFSRPQSISSWSLLHS